MTAVAFTIIALQLVSMCCTVALVGKPRKPVTGGTAVATIVLSLAVCVGVYWLWAS